MTSRLRSVIAGRVAGAAGGVGIGAGAARSAGAACAARRRPPRAGSRRRAPRRRRPAPVPRAAPRRPRCATGSPRSAASSTASPGSRSCRCATAGRSTRMRRGSIRSKAVRKLWVAITALDLVDQGRVRLDDRVTLGRDDLTLFHQPIARQDPRRRRDHHARRAAVHRDHRERQYRQRQVDALDRRARRGARRWSSARGSARSASTTASARCSRRSPG